MAPVVSGAGYMVDAGARKVKPNPETYEAVINALVRSVETEHEVLGLEELPTEDVVLPEVAFVGLSNVGKSSLLNMVVGRRTLAHKSMTPGTTRKFGFYLINDNFYLVDSPGLGFAEAPEELKEQWIKFLGDYLPARKQLKYVFHLMDGRQWPSAEDEWIMSLMANRANDTKYVVCLTKCDSFRKLESRQWAVRQIQQTLERAGVSVEDTPVIVTSAREKWGRLELWNLIQELAL